MSMGGASPQEKKSDVNSGKKGRLKMKREKRVVV